MSFRLVPKSVTLNDLERRNGVILRYFSEFGQLLGALRKSSRWLSHLLMSSFVDFCDSLSAVDLTRLRFQLTSSVARSLCDKLLVLIPANSQELLNSRNKNSLAEY